MLKRAGSFEALRPHLREARILARTALAGGRRRLLRLSRTQSSERHGFLHATQLAAIAKTPGWTAGGGVEFLFTSNWSAKFEYLYIDLGDSEMTVNVGGVAATVTAALQITLHASV